MSVKRTNETTFKDNKNAKENLLKFSTAIAAAKFPQGFHDATTDARVEEAARARARAKTATHVSDFETEMEMEKETEFLNTKRKEMAGIFTLNEKTVVAAGGTNHQHLQEQFNKSNYSTSSSSSSSAAAASSAAASASSTLRAQNKAQKPIEMLEIKQQHQQIPNDLSSKKTQSPAKQTDDLKATASHNPADTSPICLHIYMCESPSASLFHRSPLFWRCCCLCPNTLKLCSPVLRDLIFLLCFIFILMFLILSATFSESYLRHYNATLCHDCTF